MYTWNLVPRLAMDSVETCHVAPLRFHCTIDNIYTVFNPEIFVRRLTAEEVRQEAGPDVI